MDPKNFFAELKRRNVYRAAVAYGVVAWFLTQLTTQVFPFFEIVVHRNKRDQWRNRLRGASQPLA
jgi:hypothetical protein